MKTIKKYWALVVGGLIAIIGILIAIFKTTNNKKLDKLDIAIDDNKQQADIITGKVDAIDNQKQDIKNDIVELNNIVTDLKTNKEQLIPNHPKTVKSAKQNILNKTKKS